MAKISRLLQHDGRHGDAQLLSPDVVREALFRVGSAGLPTGFDNRFGQGRYHLSYWGAPVTTSDGCDFLLPAMSGYGGNRVIILPNGVSAFRFADGFNDEFEPLIAAGWAVKPQCGPIDETVHDGALSADEALAAIAGSTFYAGDWHIYLAPDGTIFSASAQELWLGRWRVDTAGRYCSRYSTWRTGAESCYSVHHEGKQWLFHPIDRWQDLVLLKVAGNPEGY